MTDSSPALLVERCHDGNDEPSIVLATFNRAALKHAISDAELIDAIEQLIDEINASLTGPQAVKVLVVTGSDGVFSGGGNIKAMQARTGMFAGDERQLSDNYRNYIQRIPRAFARLQVPAIAAVNGAAIGAGNDLVCMCDMAIAARSAVFAESFIQLGLIPGDGGAWLLPRRVGMQHAMAMALTGRRFSADEALAMNLVMQVVADDQLLGTALGLARQMAVHDGRVLRESKRLLLEAQQQTLDQALDAAAQLQGQLHHAESFKL